MYRLRGKQPAAQLRAVSALGRMEVVWKSQMGESGHLQSNAVQRKLPTPRSVEVRLAAQRRTPCCSPSPPPYCTPHCPLIARSLPPHRPLTSPPPPPQPSRVAGERGLGGGRGTAGDPLPSGLSRDQHLLQGATPPAALRAGTYLSTCLLAYLPPTQPRTYLTGATRCTELRHSLTRSHTYLVLGTYSPQDTGGLVIDGVPARSNLQPAPMAAPEPGPCASPGCAWRFRVARHAQWGGRGRGEGGA